MNWTNARSLGFSETPWGLFGDLLEGEGAVCRMPVNGGKEGRVEGWLNPRTEMLELSDAVKLVVEMPGVNQEGVEATIDNGTLTLVGTSPAVNFEGSDGKKLEYAPRKFRRSFTISDELNGEGIEAVIKDGLLTVSIPKAEKMKPKKITVRAN